MTVDLTATPTTPVRRAPEDLRISPAAHLAGRFAAAGISGARGVFLREIGFRTMIGIRVVPGTAAAEQIETALGALLPTSCGEVTAGRAGSVLWLSPDEFLAVSEAEPAALTRSLRVTLAGEPGSVTDLSANRTCFELAGPSARAVLEKGCPLDLHPRSFAADTACLTTIGPVPVILWKTADQTFQLFPRSSYADFLGRWLLDAMAEFAAPEVP